MKIASRYDYSSLKSDRPKVKFSGKGRTIQSDMQGADINVIMSKYEKTGVLVDDLGNVRTPMYGDFTEVKDYHSLLCSIRRVETAFGLLPAKVRNRFDNDPQKLIDFLEDPKNLQESIDLGLREKVFSPEEKAAAEAAVAARKEPPATPAVGASGAV